MNASEKTKTVTRLELINTLIEKLHLDKHDAQQLVTLFYEELVSALLQGESVRLSGFGNFDLKNKKARLGRNPKTKEAYSISARRVVTFHAGNKLKNALKKHEK